MLRRSRPHLAAVALVLVGGLVAGGCSSDDEPAPSTTSAPVATASTASTTAPLEVVPDRPGAVRLAVVSDSEVPAAVVDVLDARGDITVTYRETHPGWRMDALDPFLDPALATEPDVLLYSGGANDLGPLGPSGMLEALRPRLDRLKAEACLLYVIPAIDTAPMEPDQQAQVDALLPAFDGVVRSWGVATVPYLEVAAEVEAEGGYFYGEGDLGSFHPGVAAYPEVADALAAATLGCAAPAPTAPS